MENYIKWENCNKSFTGTSYRDVHVKADFCQFLEGDYLDGLEIDSQGNTVAIVLKYSLDNTLNGTFTRLSLPNKEPMMCCRGEATMPGFVVAVNLPHIEKIM